MKYFLSLILLGYASLASGQQTYIVTMDADDFIQETLTIKEGDMVVWKNTSTISHTVTGGTNCTDDGIWSSGNMDAGDSFSYTFTTQGTYDYFCEYHCTMGMTGVITVQPDNGINDGLINEKTELFLFPNPARNALNVNLTANKAQKLILQIVDVSGRIIIEKNTSLSPGLNKLILETNELPGGLYLLKLRTADNFVSKTFYKE